MTSFSSGPLRFCQQKHSSSFSLLINAVSLLLHCYCQLSRRHHVDLYITDTAMKVSRSLYCFTTSISHGVEKYFPRLLGISDAIFSLCYIGYIETCYNFEIQVKSYLTLFIVLVKIS